MGHKRFDFGKNWEFFLQGYFEPHRIEKAKESLLVFCHGNQIKGKTFLDVGCGSGLFSLAAYGLGASKIISFDMDPGAVRCAEKLRAMVGEPSTWQIREGSVLDPEFLSSLGTFDFVYAWGVLHHTGAMWQAIRNTCERVTPGGLFYLAIYNRADGFGVHPDGRCGPSKLWLYEKKMYVGFPEWVQKLIDYLAMGILVLVYLLTFNNPLKKIRSHNNFRGMSWRTDIKDWLGGYPYEFASVSEAFHCVRRQGFVLENLKSNNGLLNNEFLFRKV